MRFTELHREIKATYRHSSPAFHALATRFYLGVETVASLRQLASEQPCYERHGNTVAQAPILSTEEVEEIVANR